MRNLVFVVAALSHVEAFVPVCVRQHSCTFWRASDQDRPTSLAAEDGDWNGEVVSNTEDGRIRGCTIQNVGDSATEWIIHIDGEQADLGKFSDVIYRKLISDAKQQRFQGFKPGTIPPHLEPTYRAFAMDECAREATMEAMQQNNIRPFEDARSTCEIMDVTIPPPIKNAKKKKKEKKRKTTDATDVAEEETPSSKTFENMKGAIDFGWKPGQSFGFLVKVKGQKLKDQDVREASPLGTGGINLNQIATDNLEGI